VANPIKQEKLDAIFLDKLIELVQDPDVKPATLAVINKYLERHGVGTTKVHANLDRLKGHLEKYQDMCAPPAGEYT
jgi:hypothetical protein